jgi:hypothetical protein
MALQRIRRPMRRLTAAFFLQCCIAMAAWPEAAAPAVQLSIVDWRTIVVFQYAKDRCTDTDTPDAPARAFRDYRGQVHLFATHDDNRALIGQGFDSLHHPCSIVFRGRHSAAPRDFSDRQWLTAFYTDDGRHIPYVGSFRDVARHVCRPVGQGSLFDFGSLTYDETSHQFVAVTSVPHGSGNAVTPPGAYVATSTDLIHWAQPALLVAEAELRSLDPSDQNLYGFFSLIDERSGARDFGSISGNQRLYLYYVESDQAHAPYVRRLVKLAVSLGRS